MAIHGTWAEDGKSPLEFVINDAAQASMEAYRQKMPSPPEDLFAMMVGVLGPVLLVPAFAGNPPADVLAAQEAAAVAQQTATAAMQSFIQSAIVAVPVEPVEE